MDAGIVAGLVTTLPEGAEIGRVRAAGIRLRGVATAEKALASLAGAAAEGIAEGAAQHHAASDASRRGHGGAEEAGAAALRPEAGLTHGARLVTPRTALPAAPGTGPVAHAGSTLTEAAGRGALRLAGAAEQAAEKAAGRARPALRLGEFRLELLHAPVKVGEGLLLHEDRLRHGVRRVGLSAQPLGDQALGLRIARLVGNLLQALENIGDDLAFLVVHDRFSSGAARRPGEKMGRRRRFVHGASRHARPRRHPASLLGPPPHACSGGAKRRPEDLGPMRQPRAVAPARHGRPAILGSAGAARG